MNGTHLVFWLSTQSWTQKKHKQKLYIYSTTTTRTSDMNTHIHTDKVKTSCLARGVTSDKRSEYEYESELSLTLSDWGVRTESLSLPLALYSYCQCQVPLRSMPSRHLPHLTAIGWRWRHLLASLGVVFAEKLQPHVVFVNEKRLNASPLRIARNQCWCWLDLGCFVSTCVSRPRVAQF